VETGGRRGFGLREGGAWAGLAGLIMDRPNVCRPCRILLAPEIDIRQDLEDDRP